MNLVILDSEGNEVSFERVSLTPGGIEIVLGELSATSVPVCPAEVPEATYTPDVPVTAPSVFASTVDTPTTESSEVDVVVGIGGLGPEVDKQGAPWDERIHSSSKKLVKGTGLWAKRRNLPDGLYEQITAQLISGQPQPEPAPVSTARPTPVAGEVPEVPVNTAVPSVPDVPAAVGQTIATPAVPQAPAAATPEVPQAPAPLPENNQIGDSNDSSLSGILSAWGKKS